MKRLFAPAIALTVALSAVLSPVQADDSNFLVDWDLDADGTVTWAELQSLRRQIFETFDKDGDGALDSAEYTEFDKARAAAAAQTGSPLARRAVHGFARDRFDKNLDGKVTREEFEQALREWFTANDGNKNGSLEPGDY